MTRTTSTLARRVVSLLSLFALAALAFPATADPPARAARISYVSANASFSPAGGDDWLQARINRPVWIGDRLWSGDGARRSSALPVAREAQRVGQLLQ